MLEHVFTKGSLIPNTSYMVRARAGNGEERKADGNELTFGNERCLFLPYAPNSMDYVLPQGRDVFSADFTGCVFIRYMHMDQMRIAHVATPEARPALDAMKQIQGTTVLNEFKPTEHLDMGKLGRGTGGTERSEALGIITATGDCFAVGGYRINQGGQTSFRVAKLKKVNCALV